MVKSTRVIIIASIFLLALLCGISYSEPIIESVTGNFVHGESVTINGTNFGVGDTTPMVWDDFESGANGQNLAPSPKIGTWLLNNRPISKHTTTHFRSGSKGAVGTATSGNIYTQFGIPASGNMPDKYYYVSWWGKYANPCSTPGQVKMIQLWGTYKVGDYNPGFFFGPGSSAYIALENSGLTERIWPSYPSQNNWNHFELILKQSDVNVANGTIIVKVNGSAVYNKTNVKTRERSGESWERLYLWEGMTNQSGCGGERYLAIDDVYMNNAWARVELGNASTYNSTTKRAVQTPSAWNNSRLTIPFNTGIFGVNEKVYLYVVDSTGAVNANGYPITIGGGNSNPAPAPPAAPSNLKIVPN